MIRRRDDAPTTRRLGEEPEWIQERRERDLEPYRGRLRTPEEAEVDRLVSEECTAD